MDCGESSTVISNPKPISIREPGKLYLYRLRICSCLELMQFVVRSFWFQRAPTDGLCWFETLFREMKKVISRAFISIHLGIPGAGCQWLGLNWSDNPFNS